MNILALSVGHDCGATILRNGMVAFAANEERFNREKLTTGFPLKTTEYILDNVVSAENIDVVVFERKIQIGRVDFDYKQNDTSYSAYSFLDKLNLARYLTGNPLMLKMLLPFIKLLFPSCSSEVKRILKEFKLNTKTVMLDHHFSHAAAGYFASGFNESLAITIDGSGDGYCSKVYKTKNGKLTELHAIPMYHSLAIYYQYITVLLGFIPNRHEGKVTGLAAYGKPDDALAKIFNERISYDSKSTRFVNHGYSYGREIAELKRLLDGRSREDLSKAIQDHVEKITYKYIDGIIKKHCPDQKKINLTLSGGLFANVKLNGLISTHPSIERFFVFPHMGDGGNSYGASLGYYHGILNNPYTPSPIKTIYTGTDIGKDDALKALKESDLEYSYEDDINEKVAQLLADGKVVARCSGPMEYGPRALGNRSILYQGLDPAVNVWLNKKLEREEFMPFAPACMEEDAPEYFEGYSEKTAFTSKFMTLTYKTKEKFRKHAPAANHVDNTARPQVVSRNDNPDYYEIIKRYRDITGYGAILNTSFNVHEEPIVRTPSDAIKSFKYSKLDALALGNYLVIT
jgi:carbamoyltransferase